MTLRLPVAVPAYRRADLLLDLLRSLPADRVLRVYVSVDGARPGAEADVASTVAAARAFAVESPLEVLVHALPHNVGAAINVLGAVDWMLQHEERGVVLEDDCHPIPGFFDFAAAALDAFADRPDVWLVCGTQVVPEDMLDGNHVLSSYPLIWGWATSREQWARARAALEANLRRPRWHWLWRMPLASAVERYWHAGLRRSAEGRIDAWDLPLVHTMRRVGALAVLPSMPLVTNVGDDERATHTAHEARWTRLQPRPVELPLRPSSAASRARVERWLERELYGISWRHLLSTAVRWLLDRRAQPARPPLLQRLAEAPAAWAGAPAPLKGGA